MEDYSNNDSPWAPDRVNEIVLSEGVTTIGNNAFAETKITSISLPESVEAIGRNAFKDCKGLVEIGMPSRLKIIGKSAFQGCGNLFSIRIPQSVRQFGENAFKKCVVGEIKELPTFVSTANCGFYGLPRTSVEDYIAHGPQPAADAYATTAVPSPATSPAANNINNVPPQAKEGFRKQTASVEAKRYGESDVDRTVPRSGKTNSNSFAVIIANENYSRLAKVPFAGNDGNSFAEYCRSTLGIPDTNISFFLDATYGNINEAIAWLKDIDEVYEGDMNVIFYYAGHGVPEESTGEAFIVPVDAATPTRPVCYPLDLLYSELGSLKARNVKVFLDACFSGATRNNSMIAEGRGIALRPRQNEVRGNIVALTATSDNQTAWQFEQEGHGLFTYFLLKKLQESKGEVTMGELSDYISDNVRKISTVVNRKRQLPTVLVSPKLGTKWRSWTIK